MSKHTPGPWTVSRGAQADAFAIEGPAVTVAHIKYVRGATEANARLIAAAPMMLIALKEALFQWEHTTTAGDSDLEVWNAIKAAIAATEGRDND